MINWQKLQILYQGKKDKRDDATSSFIQFFLIWLQFFWPTYPKDSSHIFFLNNLFLQLWHNRDSEGTRKHSNTIYTSKERKEQEKKNIKTIKL